MYKGAIQVTYELLEEVLHLKEKGITIVGVHSDKEGSSRGIATLIAISENETEHTKQKAEGAPMWGTVYTSEESNNE